MTSQQPPFAGYQQSNGYSQPGGYPNYGTNGPVGGPGNYPQHDFYQQPEQQNGYNLLAILSMVFGIGSLISMGVLSIPAVILGHMSLKQMKTTGEQGRGFAIAGLVLGYGFLACWALMLLVIALLFVLTGTTLFFSGSMLDTADTAALAMSML